MSKFLARPVTAGVALLLLSGALSITAPWPAAAVTCTSGVPGDVNGDGHAEVAVSESGSVGRGRGAVHLFFGTSSGVVAKKSGSALDDQYVDQATSGVPGESEDYDRWGAATAFGDFNGDGCADLAIGAPGENDGYGAITVLYGSKAGITTRGAQTVTLDGGLSGAALAVGDLDHDGVDDLAIGAPQFSGDDADNAGQVAVLYGDPLGLNRGSTGVDRLAPEGSDLPEGDAAQNFFGSALTIGDFDGSGTPELAVGAPGANRVVIFHRGPSGFGAPRVLSEDDLGVPASTTGEDGFGASLASGDVDGDGRADLAVGMPSYGCLECDEFYGSGAVVLVRGTSGGLTATGRQFWTQDSAGVDGEAGAEDAFGYALAMGRLDAGPTDDLAIGTPQDAIGTQQAGTVTVLLGGSGGLTTDGAGGSLFDQDSAGVAGKAESGDFFGAALSAAYVQSGDQASLIVGAPDEKVGSVRGTGQFLQLAIAGPGPTGAGSRTLHLDSVGVKGKPSKNAGFGGTLS